MRQKASLLYIDDNKNDFDVFQTAVRDHPYFKWRFDFRLVWADSFRKAIAILENDAYGLFDVVFFDSTLAEPSVSGNAHQRIQKLKGLVGADAVIALPHPSDTKILQQILQRYIGAEQIIDLGKEQDRLLKAIEGLVIKKRTSSDFDAIKFDLLKRDTDLRITLEEIRSTIRQIEHTVAQHQKLLDRLDHGANTINATLLQGSDSIASVLHNLRQLVGSHEKEFDQIQAAFENLADANAVGEQLAKLQSQINALDARDASDEKRYKTEKLSLHRDRMKYLYGILAMLVAGLLSYAIPEIGKLIEAISSLFG
ncbi:MAG: hypothetical protein QNJ46_15495 [Leptolyngbyaceae cyanobacterium MO_188.B28]|nr:hypothetical protein [Leptolyngbyaceae cyanobacterium MO_188.B28]